MVETAMILKAYTDAKFHETFKFFRKYSIL